MAGRLPCLNSRKCTAHLACFHVLDTTYGSCAYVGDIAQAAEAT